MSTLPICRKRRRDVGARAHSKMVRRVIDFDVDDPNAAAQHKLNALQNTFDESKLGAA